MQFAVNVMKFRVHGQTYISHDVVPWNRALIVSLKMFRLADFHAEHHILHAVIPVVQSLVDGTHAQHDVVVHRPVPSRKQLLDIVVQSTLLLCIAHALGIDVLVVEVEDDLILAPLQHLLQCRYLVRGLLALSVHEIELADLLIGIVTDLAFACRGPVQRKVMHQYHDTVLRETEVDFEERRHH